MFSFAGDTVLDPFAGSGSTTVAAIRTGRNSISVEIEAEYLKDATRRAASEARAARLSGTASVVIMREERSGTEKLDCQSDLIDPIAD